jgi:outer membrane receptor protein involved in Fe transport
MFKTKTPIVSLIIFLSISFSGFSQETGTLRGYVKDSNTKEDIVGANIYLEALGKGVAADVAGFFTMAKVPVGSYKLRVTSVGYKTKYVENISVQAGNVTELNIYTDSETTALTEIRVVANKVTNTEVAVISEIKAAQMVVSGISASQIGRTLDRNAAEVVKRVPGVTIFNNRFINIRGLNERYNNVMLNNVFTPSMENDVRSFSFDIIPSAQIDRILVYKSPAAEIPAEFSGGLVKIFTKTIPTENSITLDYGLSIRQGTTFEAFSEPTHGKFFGLGLNNGYNDLSRFFPSTNQMKQYSGSNKNAAALQQAGQLLRNSWQPSVYTASPDQRATLTATFKILGSKIQWGNTTAINYSDSRTNFDMTRRDYVYNGFAKGEYTVPNDFRDANYSRNARIGVLHNWAMKLNKNHTLEFKNLYNQMAGSQYVNRNGFENGQNWNIRSLDQIYRGMYSSQLGGQHKIAAENTKIDWVLGYNRSFRDQPDYKRYKYNAQGELLIPQGATQTVNLGRTNIGMTENALTASLNLVQKINIGQKTTNDLELKTGVYFEQKNREFDARNLGFVKANSGSFNDGLSVLPIEKIFSQENINATTGVQLDEQTNLSDSYSAANVLMAGYVSANYAFTKKLNLIAGARAENNQQTLNSNKMTGEPINYNNNKLNILPSANLSYHFDERSLLRLAYGKTLNRPEFREIAPFSFYDFVNNRVIIGNSTLQNAEISNYDLRYEFYPTPNEIVSVAAFYKNFKNPIEIVFDDPSNPDLTFNNAEKAYSTGLELELRKSLEKLPNRLLNKINVVFNAAYILSKVKLDQATGQYQSNNRPLQGQSPYIINTSINYQNKGTQISLLYNVIGKRIYAVGSNFGTVYPDWYEMPRHVVDLTFSKNINKKLSIKGGITDLLNQSNNILQDGNQDKRFSASTDQIIQSYKPGSTLSAGVSYRL